MEGIAKELNDMREFIPRFSIKDTPLQGIKLGNIGDSGEGISDTSLRGRLELTRELLARVGYLVPSS